MSENDGSGCAMTILMIVVLSGVIMVAVALAGLPNITSAGLSWDTTASAEKQATERLRIETEAATERLRISERADTERTALLVVGIVATLAVAGGLAVAVAKENARRPVIVMQADARRLYAASDYSVYDVDSPRPRLPMNNEH